MLRLKYPHKFNGCYLVLCISILLITGILAGCAPTQKIPDRSVSPCQGSSDIEQDIKTGIRPWLNTPHRLGGTSRSGVDCSGLVMVIFKNLFNINLPRTTREQVKTGRYIHRGSLCAGDLVFFKPPHKIRHVGIYLSDGRFVHASATKGVIVSDMNNVYWEKSYWTARRILY